MSTVVGTIGLQAMACVFLLPILGYLGYLLVAERRHASGGIVATRLMMVVWCVTLMYIGIWRVYSWWHIASFDELPPGNELGGLVMSVLLFVSSLVSLVAFGLRLRAGNGE